MKWFIGMLFSILIVSLANAASFNCAKASTKVEKIVCTDKEISELDDLLGNLYDRTYNDFIQRNYMPTIITDLVRSQKQWLKSVRNACKDAICVKHAYESRINEIGLQIDENDQSSRSLALKCNYSADPSASVQQVLIDGVVYSRGQPAAINEFSTASRAPQHVELVVKPGEVAECVYPSGFRVRLKVGEGRSYPYGECGGDAEVFLSLWVNERKVNSAVWFAGHCREQSDHAAPVTYTITTMPCRFLEKTATESTNSNGQPTGHTDICVNSDFLKQYAVDPVEYPPKSVKKPKVGDYEVIKGTDSVCSDVTSAIMDGVFPWNGAGHDSGEITLPIWNDTEVDLPGDAKEGSGASESTYDFDNDGNLDRVIRLAYSTHYMDATVLLVQLGKSSETLEPVAPLQDSTTLSVPCQVTGNPSNFAECPPFSQKWDDAGFAIGGSAGENAVYFRSRYSSVYPFVHKGKSFILVRNGSEGSDNYIAVLKPLPHRKFEHACLIRQVVENY